MAVVTQKAENCSKSLPYLTSFLPQVFLFFVLQSTVGIVLKTKILKIQNQYLKLMEIMSTGNQAPI